MKAAPRDSRETALDQGQDTAQIRLFDPTRYSPVQVAIWQRLPESSARAFGIASALGSYRAARGSSAPLRGGREACGSFVARRRVPAVLQAIDCSDRAWRKYVKSWVELYIAHRCERGAVFLFTAPELRACANCGERLEIDHVPQLAARTKAARSNGTLSAAQAEPLAPESGTSSAGGVERVAPQIVRVGPHRSRRSLQGLGQGVEGERGSSSASEVSPPAGFKKRRVAEQNPWANLTPAGDDEALANIKEILGLEPIEEGA
jgi:hypothetical protein